MAVKFEALTAVLITLIVNALLFGIGVFFVLSLDAPNKETVVFLPLMVLMGFGLSPFVSALLVSRRAPHDHDDTHAHTAPRL
jgi:hypothetical protein